MAGRTAPRPAPPAPGPSRCRNCRRAGTPIAQSRSVRRRRAARRLRVKHRRTQSDQRCRDQDDAVAMRDAEQEQAEEGKTHAYREREWLRLLVGEMPDDGLQQRRGELERQRDHADLREVQRVIVLEDRIGRGDQRLHGVIEEMREADSRQHDIGRPCRSGFGSEPRRRVRHEHRRGQSLFGDDNRLVQCEIPGRIRTRPRRPTTRARGRPLSPRDSCDAIRAVKRPRRPDRAR